MSCGCTLGSLTSQGLLNFRKEHWRVVLRHGVPSEESTVCCVTCGRTWRIASPYVRELADATVNEIKNLGKEVGVR